MYLVMTKHWIALRLDPDAGHRIVKDLVVLDYAKAAVVHKDASVLAAPNLVAPYERIASGSVTIATLLLHSSLGYFMHKRSSSQGT